MVNGRVCLRDATAFGGAQYQQGDILTSVYDEDLPPADGADWASFSPPRNLDGTLTFLGGEVGDHKFRFGYSCGDDYVLLLGELGSAACRCVTAPRVALEALGILEAPEAPPNRPMGEDGRPSDLPPNRTGLAHVGTTSHSYAFVRWRKWTPEPPEPRPHDPLRWEGPDPYRSFR